MTPHRHLIMWQERQAELLRHEIKALLAPLSKMSSLYNLVEDPLIKARHGLATNIAYGRPWPLMPLIVCEAICGHYKHALPAAAAVQLFKAAGDVFDDIEDADCPESLSTRYGSAVATNVATTLLIMAERAITRLKGRGVEDSLIIRVIEAINSFYSTACAGQHLDLFISSETAVSEDTYLKVISMKSACQVECACYIGALLANADQELVNKFAKFGHNLGMAAQITNDIQGLTRGGDIMRRNITLPVIYALNQADNEVRNQLEIIFSHQSETMLDPAQIKDLLFRTGAIHYATIKMEFYKQLALDNLFEAEQHRARVERLMSFLE